VLFPAIIEMQKRKQLALLRQGLSRIYLFVFLGILPIVAVGVVYAQEIINLLFGASYLAAAPALRILFVASLLYALAAVNNAFLSGVGKPMLTARSVFTAGGINVVLNILLVPSYGIVGAASATLVSIICMLAMGIRYVQRSISFKVPWRGCIIGLLSVGIFLAVEILCKEYLPMQNWMKLVVGGAIGAVAYVLLLVMTRTISVKDVTDLLR
jgi:O-antigen/teichoic acid export membrane protein